MTVQGTPVECARGAQARHKDWWTIPRRSSSLKNLAIKQGSEYRVNKLKRHTTQREGRIRMQVIFGYLPHELLSLKNAAC
jgi:hypothetical protein